TLVSTYAWQKPCLNGLETHVLELGQRLHANVEAAKKFVPEGQFYELQYEDLVRDPLNEIQKLYVSLNLDGFDSAAPHFRAFLDRSRDYQTNKYQTDESVRQQVARYWGDQVRGYEEKGKIHLQNVT